MHQSIHDHHRQSSAHWWFRARHQIFGAILDGCVELPQVCRILDVGPGSGINLPVLQRYGSVTVLDGDLDSLRNCLDSGSTGAHGDAARLPFADGTFQLTCALDVLEHLDDDRVALAEMQRVTAPGGYLLLSVPALMILWGRQDVLSHHKRRYEREPLRDLLKGAGFELRRLTYFNSLLFAPILFWRLISRPFLAQAQARQKSDLDVKVPFGLEHLLYRIFASEARWLRTRNFPVGVSLLALCKKREGPG
jgi:SAM-dependent methyltransferase